MKITPLIIVISSIFLNSCCSIVGLVPLNADNTAVVKVMTDKTVPELKELELWTQNKKASLESTSLDAAKLRLSYTSLQPKVEALSLALQNDFKTGEEKPTAISIQAAETLATSITKFKADNGEVSILSIDWTVILINVFTPLAEEQIQKQRGACVIDELITLKAYSSL